MKLVRFLGMLALAILFALSVPVFAGTYLDDFADGVDPDWVHDLEGYSVQSIVSLWDSGWHQHIQNLVTWFTLRKKTFAQLQHRAEDFPGYSPTSLSEGCFSLSKLKSLRFRTNSRCALDEWLRYTTQTKVAFYRFLLAISLNAARQIQRQRLWKGL